MWSQRAQVARFFSQKHPKNFSAVSPPQNLGGCPVLRIFLIFPDFPKVLPLVDTRANFEQNPKIWKNRGKIRKSRGGPPETLPEKIRFFWVEKKNFFPTRKSVSADCHTLKNRKISRKKIENFGLSWPYVVPKGPGCPVFHPKTPQKFFRRPSGGGLAAFGGVVVSLCTKGTSVKPSPLYNRFTLTSVCLSCVPVSVSPFQ